MLRLTLLLLASVFGLMAGPAFAQDAAPAPVYPSKVAREVMAVYDSRAEGEPHRSRIHRFAEMPLNWLGYKVRYVDVNKPMPSPEEVAAARGIVSWLIEPLAAPEAYLDWLDKSTAAGARYIVLGDVAPPDPERLLPVINRILARIGLQHTNLFVDVTFKARVVAYDKAYVGFERPVDKSLPDFPLFQARDDRIAVHMSIEAPMRGGPQTAVIVSTHPGGGYAADEYIMHFEASTDRVRWFINPFSFFKRALGDERMPIPDVTTLSGRRIYFSHIDGDGWNNVSEVEGYRETQTLSSEVVLRELIEPFADLPVSVGLIAGDVEPELGGLLAAKDIARRLFALPQVEVATHTYTHPFNWYFYRTYDRKEEEKFIDLAERPAPTMKERLQVGLERLAKQPQDLSETRQRYVVGGAVEAPRSYMRRPFDLDLEIRRAVEVSAEFAPAGKPTALYLWSGDTTPFEAALRATRLVGVRNMNGGDSRFDRQYPSVMYVPPISRPEGAERQIYAVNSNENTYTNDWTGPYYGYFLLEETLRNTESPRRLKAMNVYYHMYSAEKPAALAAVRYFLELARKAEVVPVPASLYATLADDYFGVEIEKLDGFSWAVGRRGSLQTVRFDDADALAVDLAHSLGVIGSTRHEASLYVTLDPATPRAVVTLRGRAPDESASRERTAPTLVQSRWLLSGVRRGECDLDATAEGFGPGDMEWHTRARQGFRISAMRGDKQVLQEIRWSDDAGRLRFTVPAGPVEPVKLRLDCHE